MNYIDLVNQIWILNKEHCFKPSELSLYFHLLDVSNSLGWKNPFKQGNLVIAATIGVSEPVLQRSRQKLADAGLINFKSGKVKGQLTEYTLINLGIKKLYQSKYLSSTQSNTPSDTKVAPQVYDINKQEVEVNKNYINIQEEIIFDIHKWFECHMGLMKPNWQSLYPLANIDNCLNDFFKEKAFETFNSNEHFKRSFAKKLQFAQEKNEKEKNSGKKEKVGKAQGLLEQDQRLKLLENGQHNQV